MNIGKEKSGTTKQMNESVGSSTNTSSQTTNSILKVTKHKISIITLIQNFANYLNMLWIHVFRRYTLPLSPLGLDLVMGIWISKSSSHDVRVGVQFLKRLDMKWGEILEKTPPNYHICVYLIQYATNI
jgi:hypothetical protein